MRVRPRGHKCVGATTIAARTRAPQSIQEGSPSRVPTHAPRATATYHRAAAGRPTSQHRRGEAAINSPEHNRAQAGGTTGRLLWVCPAVRGAAPRGIYSQIRRRTARLPMSGKRRSGPAGLVLNIPAVRQRREPSQNCFRNILNLENHTADSANGINKCKKLLSAG